MDRKLLSHLPPLFLSVLLLSLPAAAEQKYVRTADLEKLARTILEKSESLTPETVSCPEQVVAREGTFSPCKVETTQGKTVIVHIEQTNDEGGIYGSLEDPEAVRTLGAIRAPFLDALAQHDGGPLYDAWASDSLRERVSRENWVDALGCRSRTLGKVTVVRLVGATLSEDKTSGQVTLLLQSEKARPRRASLNLVRAASAWRLNGFTFSSPLPLELPPPPQMRATVQSFVDAFHAGDVASILGSFSPDFEISRTRLRPGDELSLRREILGPVVRAGEVKLSFSDDGFITTRTDLALERAPGRLELKYQMCGHQPRLAGYSLEPAPPEPIPLTSEQMARTVRLVLWRANHGDAEVECPGDAIDARPGVKTECRLTRGSEQARVLITFTDLAGGFDYELKPLETE